jgi:methionine synthase I (cobalamin-dependent)
LKDVDVGISETEKQRAVELVYQDVGKMLKPYGRLEPEQAFDNYAEQADILAKEGVDLLVVSTRYNLTEAGIALKAFLSVISLPIVSSFNYNRGTHTFMVSDYHKWQKHLLNYTQNISDSQINL